MKRIIKTSVRVMLLMLSPDRGWIDGTRELVGMVLVEKQASEHTNKLTSKQDKTIRQISYF